MLRIVIGLFLAVYMTTAYARQEADTAEEAMAYAKLHPNTEIDNPNPEYGEHLEGDILVKPDSQQKNRINRRNAVTDPSLLWPGGILYYKVKEDGYVDEDLIRLQDGIDELVRLTQVDGKNCIHIVPRTNETNYVYVMNFAGCGSHVGMIGGPQLMSLSPSCLTARGTIMHEFLHAFGFHHEHVRWERDDWVKINWKNIAPENHYIFEKLSEDEIDLLRTFYNTSSVMHFSPYAFAINKTVPTIIPYHPDGDGIVGQRRTLCITDIERVQYLYKCKIKD